MKQVAHIRQISRIVAAAIWGEEGNLRLRGIFISVGRSVGAEASENELRKCGLGYRAKNLLATAKRVALRRGSLGFVERAA